MDFSTVYAAAGGGAFTWIGQSVVALVRARSEHKKAAAAADATVEQHRDGLTFDLLKAAREEVAAARREAADMRALQARLLHFDEALAHIAELIEARRTGGDAERAERHAQAFLQRMGYGHATGGNYGQDDVL